MESYIQCGLAQFFFSFYPLYSTAKDNAGRSSQSAVIMPLQNFCCCVVCHWVRGRNCNRRMEADGGNDVRGSPFTAENPLRTRSGRNSRGTLRETPCTLINCTNFVICTKSKVGRRILGRYGLREKKKKRKTEKDFNSICD